MAKKKAKQGSSRGCPALRIFGRHLYEYMWGHDSYYDAYRCVSCGQERLVRTRWWSWYGKDSPGYVLQGLVDDDDEVVEMWNVISSRIDRASAANIYSLDMKLGLFPQEKDAGLNKWKLKRLLSAELCDGTFEAALLACPESSKEDVIKLYREALSKDNAELLPGIAASPAAPVEVLAAIRLSAAYDESLAGNPAIPPDWLVDFVSSTDVFVRAAAAANPKLTPQLTRKLVGDEYNNVLEGLAGNPSVPVSIQKQLAREECVDVLVALVQNPICAPELLSSLIKGKHNEVLSAAARLEGPTLSVQLNVLAEMLRRNHETWLCASIVVSIRQQLPTLKAIVELREHVDPKTLESIPSGIFDDDWSP